MLLRDVPPGAEFRLPERNDGRRWHVTADHKLYKHGRARKPCPDAVRVANRQGGTRWLPPGTPVVLLTEKE